MKNLILLPIALILILFNGGTLTASGKSDGPGTGSTAKLRTMKNTAIIRMKEGISLFDKGPLTQKYDFQVSRPLLARENSLKYNNALKRFLSPAAAARTAAIIKAEEPLLRTYVVHYEGFQSPRDYCAWLMNTYPEIEIAEPYYIQQVLGWPNDPKAQSQEMLWTIQAPEAWSIFDGDTNMVVGITDNGFYQEHEDLKASIARNWKEIPDNDIDDDNNGYVDDYNGYSFAYKDDAAAPGLTFNFNDNHGTAVGGICGATYNNATGMTGTEGKCRLFPLKCGTNKDFRDIVYGYDGLIYCALRGFKVVNCSWGSENNYSPINESVIKYVTERDVAIVAAGGNNNNSIYPYFPANYFGVLGVGEVTLNDQISSITNMGAHVDIMAPGYGNLQPTNQVNGYETSRGGTSSASPVVAGLVALVRARRPELSNLQALEVVRQCTDDIREKNFGWEDIIPGRVNMLKAIQQEPLAIPGIRPVSFELRTNSGEISERFKPGDTANLSIKAFNYLGKANNLKFILTAAQNDGNTISVIDSVFNLATLESESAFTINNLSFRVNLNNPSLIFLRIDIIGENEYHDFFLLPFSSSQGVTTFSNNRIKFSVGDKGTFGTDGKEENTQGFGFILEGYDNQIYRKSGLMAQENGTKSVSTVYGNGPDQNDFEVVKPFVSPDKNVGIIEDSKAVFGQEVGIRIQQEYIVPDKDRPVAKVKVQVKNISGKTLNNFSAGYLLDWDLNDDSKHNQVGYFPEALPSQDKAFAAEFVAYSGDDFPVFGSAVYSKEAGAEAQAAGLTIDIVYEFTKDDQIKALTRGTTWQTEEVNDISYVIGMKFPGEFKPDEVRTFDMCIGGALTKAELAQALKECLDSNFSSVVEITGVEEIRAFPQPASESLKILFPNSIEEPEIFLTDMLGSKVQNHGKIRFGGENREAVIDLSGVPGGIYFLNIKHGGKITVKPVVVEK